MEKPIVNRVAQSSIITLHPGDFLPAYELVPFDLKDFLFMGMVLKEKEFRSSLKELSWDVYEGKIVAIYCSTDALIPSWAYMLIASYLPETASAFHGSIQAAESHLIDEHLSSLNFEKYRDAKIILKGCGDGEIPASIYLSLSRKLLPLVSSLMYGEACSAVPIFKKKKL